MRSNRLHFIILAALAHVGVPAVWAQAPVQSTIYEAYPTQLRLRMDERVAALRAVSAKGIGFGAEALLTRLSRWTTTNGICVITVAFHGGDTQHQAMIANVASRWTNYGNVIFDFGYDAGTGHFREWSTSDTDYKAQVRVAFDQTGYWSCVGSESVDPGVVGPGEASMNLQGFDSGQPYEWESITLHEFGHALGLEHEHQNPEGGCEAEFRWDPDPGYVDTTNQYGEFITDASGKSPGIYKYLGGPPNGWDRDKVDYNLRSIPNSRAVPFGLFDKKSIMEYHFDAWMYLNGTNSPCYSDENLTLSAGDEAAIAYLFPKSQADMARIHADQMGLVDKIFEQSSAEIKEQGQLQQGLLQIEREK